MSRTSFLILFVLVASDGAQASAEGLVPNSRWEPVKGSLTDRDGKGIQQGKGEVCPSSDGRPAAVTGFETFSEPYQGPGDDTALNAVRLECRASFSEPSVDATIQDSIEGKWGEPSETMLCGWTLSDIPASVTLRMEPENSDNTGAVNLRMRCKDNNVIEGKATKDWGDWIEPDTSCRDTEYLCGFRQYVQEPQGNGDDRAMTGMDLLCCKGTPPGLQ